MDIHEYNTDLGDRVFEVSDGELRFAYVARIGTGRVRKLKQPPKGYLRGYARQQQFTKLVHEAQRRARAFAGPKPVKVREPTAAEKRDMEFAEAWLRAFKDDGNTDAWAARVLHSNGVHELIGNSGRMVPVLPAALGLVDSGC